MLNLGALFFGYCSSPLAWLSDLKSWNMVPKVCVVQITVLRPARRDRIGVCFGFGRAVSIYAPRAAGLVAEGEGGMLLASAA